MKTARFIGLAVGTIILFASAAAFTALPENALTKCPDDISKSMERARSALNANDAARDHAALTCMIEAVATLDARLTGLSHGSLPFDGPIYAPKGFSITRPPAKEDR